MKKIITITTLFICLIFIFTSFSININAYYSYSFDDFNSSSNKFIKTNYKDKAYYVTYDDNKINLSIINSNGNITSNIINTTFKLVSMSVCDDIILFSGNIRLTQGDSFVNQIHFIKYDTNSNTYDFMYINDSFISSDSKITFDGENIYLIDSYSDINVLVYNLSCEFLYSVNSPIHSDKMEYLPTDDRVYLQDDQSLYYIDKASNTIKKLNINNAYEQLDFIGNNYFIDKSGQIYKNTSKVYKLYSTINIAVGTPDKVYIANNNIIEAYDDNGNKIKNKSFNNTVVGMIYLTDKMCIFTENGDMFLYSDTEIPDVEIVTDKPIQDNTEENNEKENDTNTDNDINSKNDITSNNFEIDYSNKHIYVDVSTTIAEFKNNIESNFILEFYNYENVNKTSGVIGTDFKVDLIENDKVYNSYNFVVYGDLTGEGNINSRDITAILKELSSEEQLDNPFDIAGDINNNSSVEIIDLIKIGKTTE